MKEVTRSELAKGMVLVAKQTGTRYEIVGIDAGIGGKHDPHLTLRQIETGEQCGHDTYWDSRDATYTVES